MAHFAKFISLARSPEELKKDAAPMAPAAADKPTSQPVFPYGLSICLDDETLTKLRLDAECEVGDTIHFCVMAEVTDKSERKMTDGVKRRVELQITDIALGDNEDAENKSAVERMTGRYSKHGGDE